MKPLDPIFRDRHGHVLCPYCGQRPKRVPIAQVYAGQDYGRPGAKVWVCRPCDARVGCHGDTDRPLGNLANAELRAARVRAHASFDRIWKSRRMQRGHAYAWLAKRLGIAKEHCHIGQMDEEWCEKVIAACDEWWAADRAKQRAREAA